MDKSPNRQAEIQGDGSFYGKNSPSLGSLLGFEVRSLVGRLVSRVLPRRRLRFQSRFLHLGAGMNHIPGWTNADALVFSKRFWNIPFEWLLDLRRPLDCPENTWEGVFIEHTLEHLDPAAARRLIREIYRVLRPGACVRIGVPDLELYVQFYKGRPPHPKFRQWELGGEAIHALTQSWGHLSVWDFPLLQRELKAAGFIDITRSEFGRGLDERLCRERDDRRWETIYMDARKPGDIGDETASSGAGRGPVADGGPGRERAGTR